MFETNGSNAAEDEGPGTWSHEWPHAVGEVVTALIGAGLRLEYLHEFPYRTHPFPAYLACAEPERYTRKNASKAVPLFILDESTQARHRNA